MIRVAQKVKYKQYTKEWYFDYMGVYRSIHKSYKDIAVRNVITDPKSYHLFKLVRITAKIND